MYETTGLTVVKSVDVDNVPAVAVIVVVPAEIAVKRPFESIVPMDGFEELQFVVVANGKPV